MSRPYNTDVIVVERSGVQCLGVGQLTEVTMRDLSIVHLWYS